MHPSDRQWWLAHSGDYVLGLLSNPDRLVFERIQQVEPDVKQLALEWRGILQPMSGALEPIEPPDYILPSLIANLPVKPSSAQSDPSLEPVHLLNRDASGNANAALVGDRLAKAADKRAAELADGTAFMRMLNKKESAITAWRSFAGLALVACLFLGAYSWNAYQQSLLNTSEQIYDGISIVEDPSAQLLWIVDTASDTKTLRVTAIAPPELEAGKAFALWMVTPDDSLVSMGLLPVEINESIQLNVGDFDASARAFGVSIESVGESNDVLPSSPLLYNGIIQRLTIN